MGSIERRVKALEERNRGSEDDLQAAELRAFYGSLSLEDLEWLCEPGDEAQSLVPCPHVEMVECDCKSDQRVRRGFEAYPELREESERRLSSLKARAGR
jgi:hypothetical protein